MVLAPTMVGLLAGLFASPAADRPRGGVPIRAASGRRSASWASSPSSAPSSSSSSFPETKNRELEDISR